MNTKMKVLALALVGLAGYAGSAAAGCPTNLVPPWTAQVTGAGTGGTATSQAGGLELTNPSPCSMVAAFDGTATGFSFFGVVDGTPADEPTYRFRFYIDTSAIGALGSFDSVQTFAANSSAAFDGFQNIVRVGLIGTSVAVAAADNSNAAGSFITVGTAPLSSGVHWIEGQVIAGTPGTVKLWVDATAESDTPAISLAPDNAGWVGVDIAALGVGSPQGAVVSSQAGRVLKLDAFDSRRTTFIGQ
jgi:hypothetical protein